MLIIFTGMVRTRSRIQFEKEIYFEKEICYILPFMTLLHKPLTSTNTERLNENR